MSGFRQLIHEIHRRSLWQVLGIYVVGGWLVLQVVDTLAGALNLPDWAPRFALFLLIIGLPVVLATAFVQEGLRGHGDSTGGEPEKTSGGTPIPGTGAEDETPSNGETDRAFDYLERAFAQNSESLIPILVVSWYDPLRDDPRFEELTSRINLAE